jgi:hypothetical protein
MIPFQIALDTTAVAEENNRDELQHMPGSRTSPFVECHAI